MDTNPSNANDLIDSQEAAKIMGKTYRQFTAYASYHEVPQAENNSGSPLYVRSVIEHHADIAAGRSRRGKTRTLPPRPASQAEQAESRVNNSALSAPIEMQDSARFLMAALAPLGNLPAVLHELSGAIKELQAEKAEQRSVSVPDRLLSPEEAAALLCCSPRVVSRYVKPVMNRKYRESDVYAFIERL